MIAIQAHLKEEHNIILWYKTVHEGPVNMEQAALGKLVYDRYTANDDSCVHITKSHNVSRCNYWK